MAEAEKFDRLVQLVRNQQTATASPTTLVFVDRKEVREGFCVGGVRV
jgi:hypothetical protein